MRTGINPVRVLGSGTAHNFSLEGPLGLDPHKNLTEKLNYADSQLKSQIRNHSVDFLGGETQFWAWMTMGFAMSSPEKLKMDESWLGLGHSSNWQALPDRLAGFEGASKWPIDLQAHDLGKIDDHSVYASSFTAKQQRSGGGRE